MLVSIAARNASLAMSYGAARGSSAPDNIAVALFNGNPADGGTEITGGGYARVVLPNDVTTWPDAPSAGEITSAPVTFPTSSGAWSDDADWYQIYDDDTGDEWDAMPLDEVISIAGSGVIPTPTLTVNYIDPTLGV